MRRFQSESFWVTFSYHGVILLKCFKESLQSPRYLLSCWVSWHLEATWLVALLVHQWLLFHVHIVKFQILYSVVFFPVCVQDHWGCTARSTFWIQQSSPLAFWSDRQQTQKAAGAGRFPEGQRVIIGSYYSPKWGKRGLAIKQRLMQSFVKSHNSW